jgi:hypothetical protein
MQGRNHEMDHASNAHQQRGAYREATDAKGKAVH